jgi:hypothetical protein
MKKVYTTIALTLGIVLFSVPDALAHQPRLVGSETEIRVTLPEISKAYYGELAGAPVTYHIEAENEFLLYVNILVPDIEGIDKDVSVKILKQGTVISNLDAGQHEWEYFFEPFAGDAYFRGPEYSQIQGPGSYELQVYSPDNQGKYALAVGNKESFPFIELVKTYGVLPRLKSEFFGKSPFSAYSNRMGMFLGFMLLMGLVFAAGLYFGIRLIRKRMKKRIKSGACS